MQRDIPATSWKLQEFVRSEKPQNESFPNFWNFRSGFAPNFSPNFPRIFRGFFVLLVGNGDQKRFTENPRHFLMQNSQANTKKIFTKCFWRGGKVRICCDTLCATPCSATGVTALSIRRVKSTPDPDAFEKYRDTPPICIAILLQKYALFLAESTMYTTNLYHDTAPICIAILLQKYEGQGSLEHSQSNGVPLSL